MVPRYHLPSIVPMPHLPAAPSARSLRCCEIPSIAEVVGMDERVGSEAGAEGKPPAVSEGSKVKRTGRSKAPAPFATVPGVSTNGVRDGETVRARQVRASSARHLRHPLPPTADPAGAASRPSQRRGSTSSVPGEGFHKDGRPRRRSSLEAPGRGSRHHHEVAAGDLNREGQVGSDGSSPSAEALGLKKRRGSEGDLHGTRASSAPSPEAAEGALGADLEARATAGAPGALRRARTEGQQDSASPEEDPLTPPPAYSDVAFSSPRSPSPPPVSSPRVTIEKAAAVLAIGGSGGAGSSLPLAVAVAGPVESPCPPSSPQKMHRRSSFQGPVIEAALEETPSSPPSASPPPAYRADAQWDRTRGDGTGSRRKGHGSRGSRRPRARKSPIGGEGGGLEEASAASASAASVAVAVAVAMPMDGSDAWDDVSEAGSTFTRREVSSESRQRSKRGVVSRESGGVGSGDGDGDGASRGVTSGGGGGGGGRSGVRRHERVRDPGLHRPHLAVSVSSPSPSPTRTPPRSVSPSPSPTRSVSPAPRRAVSMVPSAIGGVKSDDCDEDDERPLPPAGARSLPVGDGCGGGAKEWAWKGVTSDVGSAGEDVPSGGAGCSGEEREGEGEGEGDGGRAPEGKGAAKPLIAANSLLVSTDSRGMVRVFADQALLDALHEASPLPCLSLPP